MNRRRVPSGGERKNTAATPVKLYKPSIYNYTCYGMYYAASNAGSGSEGVCKGIKSKLNVIDSGFERMTRVEALQQFSTVSTDYDVDQYDGELHQQAESTFVSPVLTFRNPKNLSSNELLPEEKTSTSETWTCYGSTEVEYLILEDLKKGSKAITAVAPKNTGFSVRDIQGADSQRTISRLGLGFLDIIHDSNTALEPEGSTTMTPEEVPPKPPVEYLEAAEQSVSRLVEFSGKVADQMQMNLVWLGNNLMDDFPRRTYRKGLQILTILPGVFYGTVDSMGKIAGRMLGDDNNADDGRGNR